MGEAATLTWTPPPVMVVSYRIVSNQADGTQRTLLEEILLPRAGRPVMLWFYSPMFMALAGRIPAEAVVYDCMDELSAFRGAPPEMLEMERRLLARADLVFTGGRSLYEAKRGGRDRVC